jgi:hypothetical protein
MQVLTLNLDPVSANALIANLQVAIKVNGWDVARTATPIIDELLRQEAEFKASQAKPE